MSESVKTVCYSQYNEHIFNLNLNRIYVARFESIQGDDDQSNKNSSY